MLQARPQVGAFGHRPVRPLHVLLPLVHDPLYPFLHWRAQQRSGQHQPIHRMHPRSHLPRSGSVHRHLLQYPQLVRCLHIPSVVLDAFRQTLPRPAPCGITGQPRQESFPSVQKRVPGPVRRCRRPATKEVGGGGGTAQHRCHRLQHRHPGRFIHHHYRHHSSPGAFLAVFTASFHRRPQRIQRALSEARLHGPVAIGKTSQSAGGMLQYHQRFAVAPLQQPRQHGYHARFLHTRPHRFQPLPQRHLHAVTVTLSTERLQHTPQALRTERSERVNGVSGGDGSLRQFDDMLQLPNVRLPVSRPSCLDGPPSRIHQNGISAGSSRSRGRAYALIPEASGVCHFSSHQRFPAKTAT